MYKLLIVTKFNGNVATSIAEFSTQELASGVVNASYT